MKISKSYGVKWPLTRLAQRVTFVIDEKGMIRDVFHHEISAGRHVADALESLRRIRGGPVPNLG